LGEPRVDALCDALTERRALHHAAVEEDARRVQEAPAALLLRAILPAGHRVGVTGEERGEVLRDRRILRVGETELRQRGASAGRGSIPRADEREEAFDDRALHLFARELGT